MSRPSTSFLTIQKNTSNFSNWISSIYLELNNQPKVLEYMKLAEAHNKKELEKPCDEPVCLTERAQYFASIGDNDKARAHFLEALKKCDVNTHKEIVFKVRHNYAQFLSEYKIMHLPANTTNWQQTSFAAILPNRLNLHWNLIWADSIIALLPSMRPPIVCSIRHCRFMHRCCRTNWTNM